MLGFTSRLQTKCTYTKHQAPIRNSANSSPYFPLTLRCVQPATYGIILRF
jgi:hypothetical protein